MDYKLPPSVAVVVDSEVLGKTVVSVPLQREANESGPSRGCCVRDEDVENAIAERETRYVESHIAEPSEDVQLAPLRLEAIAQLEGMLTANELARRMGWSRSKGGEDVPDREKVLYALGITSDKTTMPYETAVQFAAALHLDPVDVGF